MKHSVKGRTAGINLGVEGEERTESIQQLGLVVKCKVALKRCRLCLPCCWLL